MPIYASNAQMKCFLDKNQHNDLQLVKNKKEEIIDLSQRRPVCPTGQAVQVTCLSVSSIHDGLNL